MKGKPKKDERISGEVLTTRESFLRSLEQVVGPKKDALEEERRGQSSSKKPET
jgi:hypothetical protein